MGQRQTVSAIVLSLGLIVSACSAGLAPGGPWTDIRGTQLPAGELHTFLGPSDHCDWNSATFLFIGRDDPVSGIPLDWYDEYVRNPDGLFTDLLADEFAVDIELPADAAFTGYSTPKLRLWIAPSISTAVFVEVGDESERWPRVEGDDPILCT
jgi:hypothetical protein